MDSDLLAVHSVDRFELAVPDLAQAERFYAAFGLEVARQPDALVIGAAGADHAVMRVTRGERKKLLAVRFGVHPGQLARFAEHLRARGIASATNSPRTLSFRDPDGLAIELVETRKTSPDAPMSPQPRGPAPKRSAAAAVRPAGLSHLLLFTADVGRAIDFYRDALGLRLSDRAGSNIAFLHTPHGSDHHLVAFVTSDGPGLHHSSWRVRSLDEVGHGAMQMAAQGFDQGWGVGRHVLGSNYFYYVRDPWGGWAEYSWDMDFIAAGAEWPAGDHEDEDAFYIWGPPPPAGFADNTELTAPAV
ncbi:VOC family protein [Ramlibacter sp.]|uniref:VOC family protein n=1 Tax=Ramlibacter sp. TaxID=1917967 RepID=UPI003D0AE6B5